VDVIQEIAIAQCCCLLLPVRHGVFSKDSLSSQHVRQILVAMISNSGENFPKFICDFYVVGISPLNNDDSYGSGPLRIYTTAF